MALLYTKEETRQGTVIRYRKLIYFYIPFFAAVNFYRCFETPIKEILIGFILISALIMLADFIPLRIYLWKAGKKHIITATGSQWSFTRPIVIKIMNVEIPEKTGGEATRTH